MNIKRSLILITELTEADMQSVKHVVNKFGDNHTLTELEVPWTRGKRQAIKPMCIMIQPDERTTGIQSGPS